MTMTMPPTDLRDRLADPSIVAALSQFVGGRLPATEAPDVVQATLADALASDNKPAADAEIVPWLYGIARHKVVDWYRKTRREVPRDLEAGDDAAVAAESAPQSARDLLRWAERELPEGEEHKRTLEWMLREGAGEKLEAIAAEENLPAPRVRQRVSRLRKHYRTRWAAQMAILAGLLVIAVLVAAALRKKDLPIAPLPAPSELLPPAPVPTPIPQATPEERAAELRRDALDKCAAQQWRECLDGLDSARDLDPAGDDDPNVQSERRAAEDALKALTPQPEIQKSQPHGAPYPTGTDDTSTTLAPPPSSDAPMPAPQSSGAPAPRPAQSSDTKLMAPPGGKAPGRGKAAGLKPAPTMPVGPPPK
jgi:DNA-directed RNA polymerase specialized sigma24 family protein